MPDSRKYSFPHVLFICFIAALGTYLDQGWLMDECIDGIDTTSQCYRLSPGNSHLLLQ